MTTPLLISFWSRGEEQYRFLSNFYPAVIRYRGRDWPSLEHLYQACRYTSPEIREQIRQLPEAWQARNFYAQNVAGLLIPDFSSKRLTVMRALTRLKYDQHPELAALLLATGEAVLVHHAPWDSFWGSGKNNRGENWQGRILMEERTHQQERGNK